MGDWDLYFLAGVESHASAGSEDRRGQQRDESNTRYRDRHISSRLYGGDRGGLSSGSACLRVPFGEVFRLSKHQPSSAR